MNLFELIFLSVSLAMDAFAVSISSGLCLPNVKKRYALLFGVYFGFFQFIMPLIGFALGYRFSYLIRNIDHFIAFGLLGLIGVNMIKESFEENTECICDVASILSFKHMFLLAVATSIDALAVGVSFAFLQTEKILFSCSVIGIVAFIFSFCGLLLGKKAGRFLNQYAERIGGCILIGIGTKILIEHLFFGA